jgi:hypothetical protein
MELFDRYLHGSSLRASRGPPFGTS